MAEYDYEAGGFMSLYFVLTFLIIALIPLTSSLIPSLSPYAFRWLRASSHRSLPFRIRETLKVRVFRMCLETPQPVQDTCIQHPWTVRQVSLITTLSARISVLTPVF